MMSVICALFAVSAVAGNVSETIVVRDGRCDWGIVCGTNANDRFACAELIEIFEKATGVGLALSEGVRPQHAFLVGGQFAKRPLADEETSLFVDGGDIVLAGGGKSGSAYAVYDFCEKAFGYRIYGAYEGAEVCRKTRDLKWATGEISTRPKFTGYRVNHGRPIPRTELEKKFYRRNRCNFGDRPLTSRPMLAQHGHLLFVPPYDKDYSHFLKVKWKGMFKEHPEYFSLDRSGKRTDKGQLCFSNRALRDLYIARFREVAGKLGKGIYMVGSNDSHNERYCWCDGCARLMEKYGTNGGPLFDFILELCANVRDLDDVYVATLAYKRPEQTELAPRNVRFPDNFVCDAAFLNADRPIKAMKDIVLPDGTVYNRFRNLKEWNRITDHLAWWYYGGASPLQTYRRMQIEMRELLEAGVDSVGACGTGGNFEFADVGTYMYFQLLRDPEIDADSAVRDVFAHKYGAAADAVFLYLKELEEFAIGNWSNPDYSLGCDLYIDSVPVEGTDLVRWLKLFERAEASVAGAEERVRRNVRTARAWLDCMAVVYASRIRAAAADYPIDTERTISRGYAMCDEAEAAGIVARERNPARRILDSMRYYANLKSEALPPELALVAKKDVRLYLPEEPLPFWRKTRPLLNDPLAAAGVAMMGTLKDPAKPIVVQLYDSQTRQWLRLKGPIEHSSLRDGRYTMINLGVARLPRLAQFVLGNCWGTSMHVTGLGRFYDPSYHEKRYEFWASVRVDGDRVLCDRIYLVDKGMP